MASIGISGAATVYICTAYYTRRPLEWLEASAKGCSEIVFAFRHDPADLTNWMMGSVDPPSLVSFVARLQARGTSVSLWFDPTAHAKMYLGNDGLFIGSANFSTNGFSASVESGVLMTGRQERSSGLGLIRDYLSRLRPLSLNDLTAFVNSNSALVLKNRRVAARKSFEARLSNVRLSGVNTVIGDYPNFQHWLAQVGTPAAREILQRSLGSNNLQGHVHRSFYGIRQYLLSAPNRIPEF